MMTPRDFWLVCFIFMELVLRGTEAKQGGADGHDPSLDKAWIISKW